MGLISALKQHWALIDPTPVAIESYKFWRSVGYDHDGACSWLGNEQGEDSFDNALHGDHGEATGPAQHHRDRIETIKAGCGIDIATASHLDQLRAIDWSTQNEVGYRHVKNHILAAQGIRAKVTVIVAEYEHSGNQARDIDRRTGFAEDWAADVRIRQINTGPTS